MAYNMCHSSHSRHPKMPQAPTSKPRIDFLTTLASAKLTAFRRLCVTKFTELSGAPFAWTERRSRTWTVEVSRGDVD